MKKFSLVFLIACFSFLSASAQQDRPFRFGFTVSPSVSWLSPETRGFVSEGRTLGIGYGLIGDFRLGEFSSILTGVNISHFGGKLSFDDRKFDRVTEIERTYKLRYLELPVSIKLKTPEIGYFSYYGQFGVAPGFNLKATGNDSFVVGDAFMQEVDIKNHIPLLRAALVIGLGLEYSLGGRVSLFGGITYNNGFTNNLRGYVLDRKPSANANYVMLNLGLVL